MVSCYSSYFLPVILFLFSLRIACEHVCRFSHVLFHTLIRTLFLCEPLSIRHVRVALSPPFSFPSRFHESSSDFRALREPFLPHSVLSSPRPDSLFPSAARTFLILRSMAVWAFLFLFAGRRILLSFERKAASIGFFFAHLLANWRSCFLYVRSNPYWAQICLSCTKPSSLFFPEVRDFVSPSPRGRMRQAILCNQLFAECLRGYSGDQLFLYVRPSPQRLLYVLPLFPSDGWSPYAVFFFLSLFQVDYIPGGFSSTLRLQVR